MKKIALALLLAATATASTAGGEAPAGVYECPGLAAGEPARWTIEFDERLPLATVNDEDLPADYTPSHIVIRLARQGPTLTIGRTSGRLVASAAGGDTVALGRCTARVTT